MTFSVDFSNHFFQVVIVLRHNSQKIKFKTSISIDWIRKVFSKRPFFSAFVSKCSFQLMHFEKGRNLNNLQNLFGLGASTMRKRNNLLVTRSKHRKNELHVSVCYLFLSAAFMEYEQKSSFKLFSSGRGRCFSEYIESCCVDFWRNDSKILPEARKLFCFTVLGINWR